MHQSLVPKTIPGHRIIKMKALTMLKDWYMLSLLTWEVSNRSHRLKYARYLRMICMRDTY